MGRRYRRDQRERTGGSAHELHHPGRGRPGLRGHRRQGALRCHKERQGQRRDRGQRGLGHEAQPEDVPLFATDNVAAARKVPDLLAEELGKKGGDVAFIPFQQGTLTNELREQGFKEGLKAHPELKLVAEQSSQSDYNTALTVTENILTANPGLDAIFAANEPGVLGAAEAVRQAGKAGDITIVGWDGNLRRSRPSGTVWSAPSSSRTRSGWATTA